MSGSGTCRDVCEELGIPCYLVGHSPGFRRLRPAGFPEQRRRSISSGHTRRTGGKSFMPTMPATFRDHPRWIISCARYGQFIRNCAGALKRGGKLAILMGDYCDHEAGFVPLTLPHQTARLRRRTPPALHRHHPIQPRGQQRKKVYRSSFIPGLHDVCMIFEKANYLTTNQWRTTMKPTIELFTNIAREHLNIPTLETRNSDCSTSTT